MEDKFPEIIAALENPTQNSEVEAWRKLSPENEATYQQVRKVWEATAQPRNQFHPDATTALAKVNSRLKWRVLNRWVPRVAAMLLITLGVVWVLKSYVVDEMVQYTAKSNETILLPDSTSVTLQKGAQINYPKIFTDQKRQVALEGKAYFNVKRDTKRPFLIKTSNSITQVLGTRFVVAAAAMKNGVDSVTVESGRVAVSNLKQKRKVILAKGDQAIYNGNSHKMVKQRNKTANFMAWVDGKLRFNNVRLEELANELQKRYQVDIQFEDSAIKKQRFSGAFLTKQPVDVILKIVTITSNLEYTKTKDGTIILSKKRDE
ncbi:DUF4974 domain-containing protein [Prolixibacteraceae bacterium JC049]|nr:DUF4974 domain-containing protein [Prolixibacteraceae bacterium JC049]